MTSSYKKLFQWLPAIASQLFPARDTSQLSDEAVVQEGRHLYSSQSWFALKRLFNSERFKILPQLYQGKVVNQALSAACHYGEMQMVRYILSSKATTPHVDIIKPLENGLSPLDNATAVPLIKELIVFANHHEHKMEAQQLLQGVEKSFYRACERGNLQAVHYFLTDSDLAHLPLNPLGRGLKEAFYRQHKPVIDYLLRFIPTPQPYNPYDLTLNNELTKQISHHVEHDAWKPLKDILLSANFYESRLHGFSQGVLNKILWHACEKGSINIVKNILTNVELQRENLLASNVNVVYKDAITGVWWQTPLHATSLLQDGNLHTPLSIACKKGHLEVVKYLLEEINDVEVHVLEDKAFKSAVKESRQDLVKYLVIEHKLPLTTNITNFCTDKPEIMSMFTSRDLNHHLHETLLAQSIKRKPLKI